MKLPKFRPIFRVQAYFSVVAFVVFGAKMGLAYKSTEQSLQEAGGQIAEYLKLSVDGVESVSINGERFAFAVTMTDMPVGEVLSITERACAENSGNLIDELGPVLEHAKKEKPGLKGLDASKLTTLRRDGKHGESSGDVTCFTRPRDDGKSAQHPGFMKRMQRFTENMALGELGEGHYLRADREEKANKTRILYVRSLGEMKMTNFFSGDGDSPGKDPKDIPRPPSSERTLSAGIERNGDGFYSYESKESADAILNFYDQKMPKGWEKMPLDGNEPELTFARAFAQDDRATYVVIEPLKEGSGCAVALITLGQREQQLMKAGR
jgi:hypothetical protein